MTKLTKLKSNIPTLKGNVSVIQKPSVWGSGRGGRPWRRIRECILLRDKYTCCYCGKVSNSGMEVDHIINKARGGSDDEANLQTLCYDCHKKKTQVESKQ